jgi:phage FluMu gp28-like protein
MAREFIETVAMWARAFSLASDAIEDAGDVLEDVDREKGVQAFRVRFASGHKVVALSSRPSNLRGKQGRVVLDEYAFHPEPAELLKAAMALLIWGGRVIIISTHNGEEHAFNQLIQDIRAGRQKYSLHRITFDDALKEGLYRRICERRGITWTPQAEATWRAEIISFYGEDADEELFCIPRGGGGAFISGVLVQARMVDVPVIRWRQKPEFAQAPKYVREQEVAEWCHAVLLPLLEALDPGLLSYFGEDFGRTGDLTVIWPLQVRGDLVRCTPFVVELGLMPFEQQRQILFYIVDRLPRFVHGALDARGNGQYLAEVAMQRYGSGRISQVMLSPAWYRENMPPYKAAFEDAMITLPRDAEILNDHRAIRMEKGIAKVPEGARSTGSGGQQRHGDAAIAGALAYAASCTDATDYDYTPAPRNRRRVDEHHDAESDFYFGAGTAAAYHGYNERALRRRGY